MIGGEAAIGGQAGSNGQIGSDRPIDAVQENPDSAFRDPALQDSQSAAEQVRQEPSWKRTAIGYGIWASVVSAVVVAAAFVVPGAAAGRRAVAAGHGQAPRPEPWDGAEHGGGAAMAMSAIALGTPPAAARRSDPNRLGHNREDRSRNTEHGDRGPASKRIIAGYGFWIFLLSDIIMFSAFFASYAVLSGQTAGGPGGRDLFDLRSTGIETACLLTSSFTCGLATIGIKARWETWFYGAMAATFVLGAAFIGLEVREFSGMVAQGAGPSRSAFLSAFFALVGCHGLHVTIGLLWLLMVMAQVRAKGYRPAILRRVLCFSLFWHALDIVWVALFTVVYLMGVMQ